MHESYLKNESNRDRNCKNYIDKNKRWRSECPNSKKGKILLTFFVSNMRL